MYRPGVWSDRSSQGAELSPGRRQVLVVEWRGGRYVPCQSYRVEGPPEEWLQRVRIAHLAGYRGSIYIVDPPTVFPMFDGRAGEKAAARLRRIPMVLDGPIPRAPPPRYPLPQWRWLGLLRRWGR